MDVKTISIDNIGLSRRSSNALHRAGVKTVGEMLAYTGETLSEIRNVGHKSIDEILRKIDEYRKYDADGCLHDPEEPVTKSLPDMTDNISLLCESEEGKSFIRDWVDKRKMKVGDLELLSARAYNHLLLNKMDDLSQIVFSNIDELMEIPRMDPSSAEEIVKMCRVWLKEHEVEILEDLKKKQEE